MIPQAPFALAQLLPLKLNKNINVHAEIPTVGSITLHSPRPLTFLPHSQPHPAKQLVYLGHLARERRIGALLALFQLLLFILK